MATFVTRAQWGGRARRSSNTNITPDRGGVSIHHVGGSRFASSPFQRSTWSCRVTARR